MKFFRLPWFPLQTVSPEQKSLKSQWMDDRYCLLAVKPVQRRSPIRDFHNEGLTWTHLGVRACIRVIHMFLLFCNLTRLSCSRKTEEEKRFRNRSCEWTKVSSYQSNLLALHQPLIPRNMQSSKPLLRHCLLYELQLGHVGRCSSYPGTCFGSGCTLYGYLWQLDESL